jgi:hypothetical protein
MSKGYIVQLVSVLEGRAREIANEMMKGRSKNVTHILQHRLNMAIHLDRPLRSDEQVHHKDENKLNNHISNLQLMSVAEHARYHALRQRLPLLATNESCECTEERSLVCT